MLNPAGERCSANSNIDRGGTRYRAMKDRIVEIPTKAGRMPTFVTHPEQDGPFPPVIVFMDVWGVRDELYDIARRIVFELLAFSTFALTSTPRENASRSPSCRRRSTTRSSPSRPPRPTR